MNHLIVRETSAEIRTIARGVLQKNWSAATLGIAVFYIFTIMIPQLLIYLMPSAAYSVYNEAIGEYVTVSYAASLYDFVLTGPFAVGLCSFMLAFFRRRDRNVGHLFSGFELFFKSFGLLVVQGIFIFLWTLLFFFPGIIAALRYSQAFFILADSPEKGIIECIRESKAIMDGNKTRLFFLNLSFIGWMFLGMIPAVILPISDNVLSVFLQFFYMIPYFAVLAYMQTANTAFYELATGHLVVREGSGY